ncbi:MAG: MarR family transcriptional regulator [Acidimicrobiales bacterium]
MGAPEHVTDYDITTALAALPDITSPELAGALGIGRSTAAKRLARLEAAGTIRRSPGGRSGGARVADRWSLATPAPDVHSPLTAATDSPAASSGGAAHVLRPGPADPPTGGSARPEAGGDASGRLGRGALGALVREYLAEQPGQSFGPSGIGKALGRSPGAVSNLCGSSVSSATAQEVAEGVGISRSAASKVLADLEREGQVVRSPGGREGGQRLPDRWSLAVVAGSGDDKVRLGRGQLRSLVIDHLSADPGEVSPAQLAKVLGHSAGAISNVLVKLVETGEAVQTTEHPRRYAVASR